MSLNQYECVNGLCMRTGLWECGVPGDQVLGRPAGERPECHSLHLLQTRREHVSQGKD